MKLPRPNFLHLATGAVALPVVPRFFGNRSMMFRAL
jgi:hypothetical protein